ncbi:salicylate/benzoate carboxyl methyltransferase-like [Brassica napus]|uniref:salicylate/benzoate carboxyl methyltransferase-like n=1 Tax=Brassica napus TaxID=3708 RepID=UPI0020792D20|nr:salicylate/benzoate carboxyl methyltransferase-like [Brassica napus]
MDSRFNDTVHSLRYTDEKSDDEYAFVKALRMSGGVGANSYSANSLLQRRVLSMAKPVLVGNTEEMMMNLNFPNYIKVAELGCSSGQNTFLAISEIINTINVLCQNSNQNPPEIDCCLNDLPENDFNTTFKFVPFFNKEIMMTNQASCFVYGAPGSFYSRLFDIL